MMITIASNTPIFSVVRSMVFMIRVGSFRRSTNISLKKSKILGVVVPTDLFCSGIRIREKKFRLVSGSPLQVRKMGFMISLIFSRLELWAFRNDRWSCGRGKFCRIYRVWLFLPPCVGWRFEDVIWN